jgi:L-rhamnose mutarotase
MKRSGILIMVFLMILISCQESEKEVAVQPVKRVATVTGIKPDKISYYKQLHVKTWPAVLKKLTQCNIRNYSIYLQKINGNYFLFSYFEYIGVDFDADMEKMAADSATQKWWKLTDPTQIPLPEAAREKKIWTSMEEVFHTN